MSGGLGGGDGPDGSHDWGFWSGDSDEEMGGSDDSDRTVWYSEDVQPGDAANTNDTACDGQSNENDDSVCDGQTNENNTACDGQADAIYANNEDWHWRAPWRVSG